MQSHANPAQASRFDLRSARAYRAWRDAKLRSTGERIRATPIEIRNPLQLEALERAELGKRVAAHNLAFFRCEPTVDASALKTLGRQLGLEHLDHHLCADPSGIAVIADRATDVAGEYIPYTNRALNWHTDGYYRPAHDPVRAFILYCVEAAASGGANRFFDHELAYIRFRDREPRWIQALSQADALTIPGYETDSGVQRDDVVGPVFSVCDDGELHMRYTARARHVRWKGDERVAEALDFLRELLNGEEAQVCYQVLQPGEGVVCANVLHAREAFVDPHPPAAGRTLLRARYRDPLRCAALA